METALEVVEGRQFDRGYPSPYMVTDPERMEAVLEDALILIHEKLSVMNDMLPLREQVAQAGKPFLIIAEEVEGEALATVVVYKLRARIIHEGTVVTLTGGKAITENLGIKLENIKLEDLGKAKNVVVDSAKELAYGFDGESNEYVDMMQAGIIDPTKVERIALQNVAPIASVLLTTEALITDIPEEKGAMPPMSQGGGMGGDF